MIRPSLNLGTRKKSHTRSKKRKRSLSVVPVDRLLLSWINSQDLLPTKTASNKARQTDQAGAQQSDGAGFRNYGGGSIAYDDESYRGNCTCTVPTACKSSAA